LQLSGYRNGLGGEQGETVAAEIVMNHSETLTLEDIRQYLAGRLARYKIPRLVYFSEQLPRTPTVKIPKFVLREMHSDNTSNATVAAFDGQPAKINLRPHGLSGICRERAHQAAIRSSRRRRQSHFR
jgi:hypothetical protein